MHTLKDRIRKAEQPRHRNTPHETQNAEVRHHLRHPPSSRPSRRRMFRRRPSRRPSSPARRPRPWSPASSS
eukprot:2769830-Alexandrium_andersonii.AAC.1